MPPTDVALFRDRWARGVVDVRHDEEAVKALDTQGFWAVVATFEGEVTAIRFEHVSPRAGTADAVQETARPAGWAALTGTWHSSLSQQQYVDAVRNVRRRIATGEVYQANICRILSHELNDTADLDGLCGIIMAGNPAPHLARVRCDAAGVDLVCASPELFLARADGRVTTRPIKGTAPRPEAMLEKDFAENVMIVDLMRNDLSPVCQPGTVQVDGLCEIEQHPGLVHLVSTVSGTLRAGTTWAQILAATFPPGSVSGAPKSTALKAIRELEPVPRGPYCGAIGWVDADAGTAELAVGIRTFWAERDGSGQRWLHFGTGAGITWGSDPQAEWAETELKAARLVRLASGA